MHKIAVLYARKDSIYKSHFDLDVYDEQRDARTFDRPVAVVAHPPCRAWARLRKLAKPAAHEKQLAIQAVNIIRANGGVLEHPESSTLFDDMAMPKPTIDPGAYDEFGGYTIPINQYNFGHKARKATWLYICGIKPTELPSYPFKLGEATHVVTHGKRCKPWKKSISMAEREHTPFDLAQWLVEIAQMIEEKKHELT